jgi:CRP/FNR family transcriptional regulator, cyclic AMP receptor protein
VEELLSTSAHARLAHSLLDLANGHGVADTEGMVIPLRLSQTDVGRLVGLRRETVNGILQEWREQRIAESDRRSIRLRDMDALKRIATGTDAQKPSSAAEV